MQHLKRTESEIEFDPPPKTHFLAKLAIFLVAAFVVLAVVALVKDKGGRNKTRITGIAKDRPPIDVTNGGVIRTRFFDVVADTSVFVDSIHFSRGSTHLPAERASRYLVVSLTLTNIDDEARMMPEGQLTIETNSTELKYDDPLVMTGEGWGALVVTIDPGITRKTKLVYKLPRGITGNIYYYPDASYNRDRIQLASI